MDADKAPDFSKMTGKELDIYGLNSGMNAPENWAKMKVAEKRKYLADLTQEVAGPSPDVDEVSDQRDAAEADRDDLAARQAEDADPRPYDLTQACARFKERRLRMSVYDMLVLGAALGVPEVNTLTYDRLRKRIRMAIRDVRNG